MADVLEERVRSLSLSAGVAFAAAAVLLALSIVLYPSLPSANETNRVLEVLVKEGTGSWMWLHAFMVLGFVLVTIGFAALAFLLHLRGSSGPASVISSCALLSGALWTGFLSVEFFVHPFIKNLMGVEPGLATMLFNTYWFWKMGALWVAGLLTFVAVIASGTTATARGILPLWLGWGGAVFATLGLLIYVFEFYIATATGAAINPMRGGFARYGVGLPLQLWVLGTGAIFLRDYRERVSTLPPQTRSRVPRREIAEPESPAAGQKPPQVYPG
jgi:hypothetical protein